MVVITLSVTVSFLSSSLSSPYLCWPSPIVVAMSKCWAALLYNAVLPEPREWLGLRSLRTDAQFLCQRLNCTYLVLIPCRFSCLIYFSCFLWELWNKSMPTESISPACSCLKIDFHIKFPVPSVDAGCNKPFLTMWKLITYLEMFCFFACIKYC